jgi:pimeloyl-ACP methyl ester carboxylesterase
MPVKRWEATLAVVGAGMIALGAAVRLTEQVARRELLLRAAGCTVPVSALNVPADHTPAGAAVVFHGLSANRGLMVPLGRSLALDGITAYLVDLSGHGDNTDSFSFDNVERCARAVVQQLEFNGALRPERTVLIGHSMGGDIVLRLADAFPAAATVAISPGPLVPVPLLPGRLQPYSLPQRLPRNSLVLVGGVDLPMFGWAAHKLEDASGGIREAPADFREGRAFAVRTVAWATHTGLILRASVFQQASQWAQASWGEAFLLTHNDPRAPMRAAAPLGVVLLLPLLASLAATLLKKCPGTEPPVDRNATSARVLLRWAMVCLAVVVILCFGTPLRFLGMTTGSYLASVFLLIGLSGLGDRLWRDAPRRRDIVLPRALTGLCLGLAVVLGMGLAISGEFGDLWMNAARGWRFGLLIPLLFPYFLLEESLLDAASPQGARASRRWGTFYALRGILWLTMMLALFFLGGQEILILVMGLVFLVFSAGQRLGGDMVRRRLGGPDAAAAFNTALGAWFLAAVFPLV